MVYQEFLPSKNMQLYIDCFWIADIRNTVFNFEFLPPNLTSELVFCFNKPFYYDFKGTIELAPIIHILSTRQTGIKIHLDPFTKVLGVRFKPGMIKYLLGPEVNHAPDQIINADDYEHALSSLYFKLARCTDINNMLFKLEDFLLKRTYSASLLETETSLWVEQVLKSPTLSISDLSSSLFYTCTRNIQLRMKRFLNISPTYVKKIGLFNYAINNIYSSPKVNLTKVAIDCGFYDQAHFNRFFKKISNQSPTEFMRSNKYIVKTTTNAQRVNID